MRARWLALAVAAFWLAASVSAATSAIEVGPIYYGGADGIFRIEGDGSGLRRLTRGDDVNPVVSPDGIWIAFTRSRVIGENFRGDPITTLDLYRVGRNGTGLRLLLRVAHDPAWSPDSKRLDFARFFGKPSSIWTANADGSGPRQLSAKTWDTNGPSWSPDGRRIAFDRWTGDYSEVFVVNADGTGERRLLLGKRMSGVSPAWSPTGRRIAFFADAPCCGNQLDGYVVVVDGAGKVMRKVGGYFGESSNETPEWAPGGRMIAFSQYLDAVNSPNNDYIFAVPTTGVKLPERLTGPNATDPEWSSDGRRIAFVKDGTISLMTSEGRDVRRVIRVSDCCVGGMDW
jgi:Tol biopolymer transport system component